MILKIDAILKELGDSCKMAHRVEVHGGKERRGVD